jgi:hypothetical protein
LPIDDYFLSDAHDLRLALQSRFGWYLHITSSKNFESIKSSGLEPRSDEDSVAPPEVQNLMGWSKREHPILCLNPLLSECIPPPCCQGDPDNEEWIVLAVSAQHLPERLSLDWSYSPEYQTRKFNLLQTGNDIQKAVQLATELGSIACYSVIPPEHLRVQQSACLINQPWLWPKLLDENTPTFIRRQDG